MNKQGNSPTTVKQQTEFSLGFYALYHVSALTYVSVCSVVYSRCGLLLCGWVVVYTIGTHNVARAHAPHCAAEESDFGLCPSLSLAGLLAHTTHSRYEHTDHIHSMS